MLWAFTLPQMDRAVWSPYSSEAKRDACFKGHPENRTWVSCSFRNTMAWRMIRSWEIWMVSTALEKISNLSQEGGEEGSGSRWKKQEADLLQHFPGFRRPGCNSPNCRGQSCFHSGFILKCDYCHKIGIILLGWVIVSYDSKWLKVW